MRSNAPMSLIDSTGIRTALPRAAREPDLTARQAYNRRNAFWLFSHEIGMYDPALGHARPHSPQEIADVFGVCVRTVQLGIASARRVRAQCEALKSA
jgi:hypothetical protein